MLPFTPPLAPVKHSAPFSDPDWLWEVKHDGWRCLAFIDDECRLVSRHGNTFNRFRSVAKSLAAIPHEVVIDGELVCLDERGRTQFYNLMFNRSEVYLYAFDLLWLDGEDLRERPCLERKERLKEIVADGPSRLLYVDHLIASGEALFDQVCAQDLEGIVAKPAGSAYRQERHGPWIKVKNPTYSQLEGRGDLFHPST